MKFKIGKQSEDILYKGKNIVRTKVNLENVVEKAITMSKRMEFHDRAPKEYNAALNIRLPNGMMLMDVLLPQSRSKAKNTITEAHVRRTVKGCKTASEFQKSHNSEWQYAFMHKSNKGNFSLLKELFPKYKEAGITKNRTKAIKQCYNDINEFFTEDPYYGGFAKGRGIKVP